MEVDDVETAATNPGTGRCPYHSGVLAIVRSITRSAPNAISARSALARVWTRAPMTA